MRGAFRKRGRERNTNAEELNVTPLMNLFVAIVPLLLLSAVFVSLASIDLSTPTRSQAPRSQGDFVLAVRVTARNWWVDARGEGSVRLEKGDSEGLLQVLAAQQAAHPTHTSLLLACEDSVEYEEVVNVLDVAALAGFPDCALVGAVTDAVAAVPGTSDAEDAAPPAPQGGRP